MACLTDSIPWRGDFEQKLVYAPEKRPGFVAWVTAFPYGDGSIGISFDDPLEAETPDFIARAPPAATVHRAALSSVSEPSIRISSFKSPAALSSRAAFNELEHTSPANPA